MWDVDFEALTEALAVPGSKLSAAGIASVRSRVCNLRPLLPQFKTLEEFRDALHGILADGSQEISLTEAQKAQITQRAKEKFSTWEWIYGRSPKTEFKSTKKFPCGTVTAHYTLTRGVFSELEFTGDFIGNRPASELSAALIGKRLEDVLSQPVQEPYPGGILLRILPVADPGHGRSDGNDAHRQNVAAKDPVHHGGFAALELPDHRDGHLAVLQPLHQL